LISDIMFTPTQQRIIDKLSDGQAHSFKEMLGCLRDELDDTNCLNTHISHIRRKIRPQGQDIICQRLDGVSHYRLIRLMASSYDGYR
jgi:DNA-binding response OmpR family regulator